MRAAVINRLGEPPSIADVDEPQPTEGQALVEVTAAPLNPVDLAIAAGHYFAGVPTAPYVPGREGFGRVIYADKLERGSRVWFEMPGGLGGPGSLCERVAVDEIKTLRVAERIDDVIAACLGIAGVTAWLALGWRGGLKRGETVVVLGAGGAVGAVAVQGAKILGALRVVAAARGDRSLARARELGADAVCDLASDDPDALAAALSQAAAGQIDLVVDPLWGKPAAAAVRAASRGARVVHLGQTASREATFDSDSVRGKALSILGLSMPMAPQTVKQTAYEQLLAHAANGKIAVDHEVFPLDEVPKAWREQAKFPHQKLVLAP